MKIYFNIFLLLFTQTSFSQENTSRSSSIYSSITFFDHENKNKLSIIDIVKKQEQGYFNKEQNPKIYKKLVTKTLWHHFSIPPKTNNNNNNNNNRYKYFTIADPYLPFGKVYIKRGDKIDSLYKVSYNKEFPHKNIFYRYPLWKLPVDDIEITEVFLKVKNDEVRMRLSFFLETENEFLRRVETEYFYFGLYIAFLISMTLILVFFSVLKKEYAVLFYSLYILTVLIEFLAGKGIGLQYFWYDSEFLINNIRSLSQTIGVVCIGYFYLKFYKLNITYTIPKLIFRLGIYIAIILLVFYLYKFIFGGLTTLYLYVWTFLKIVVFIWVLNHVYLTIKKQLPVYLVVAFILPLLAVIYGQIMNPEVGNELAIKFSGPALYYITLSFEILLFTRYIFGSVIDTQQKYFKLQEISDELKYNFQNKTLEFQHKERNNLVNNVHDTFGGYLEALKLRLLQKADNTPGKIQEILDAFYKDYRYLLNSLYAPKINSENFITSLIEFCKKLDELTNQKINYTFNIDDIDLQQEKCVHLYRIISELTTNAIKYSEATEINILMHQKTEYIIVLEVSDNGIGFNQDKMSTTGFGLNSVKDRIEQINGSLEINSNKKGTLFKIEIPINE